jgi:transcriptional regulator with XRE-family HTH domain
MTFSEHLMFLREKNKVLQKDIAKELGISVHAYQRFEYGEQEPRLSALIALADFYGLAVDELICHQTRD